MLRIKLVALEHPTPNSVDISDRKTFSSTVLWLEDQKIRHYKIEDRKDLRTIDPLDKWEIAYTRYKKDLDMPNLETPLEQITWLLGYAVRLEYSDRVREFKSVDSEYVLKTTGKSSEPCVQTENSFDNMDFHHKDFIAGVRKLASKLQIAYHPDHLTQLEAVKQIVQERLGTSAAAKPIIDGTPYPFEKGDDVVSEEPQLDYAGRILRLLQIHNLRDLQTRINETIVGVQELTADPKTNTKLGKIGF